MGRLISPIEPCLDLVVAMNIRVCLTKICQRILQWRFNLLESDKLGAWNAGPVIHRHLGDDQLGTSTNVIGYASTMISVMM